MDRLSRAKAVAGEKSAALKVVLTHNPPCVDCRFRVSATEGRVCGSPAYWDTKYDPVSGRVTVKKMTLAKDARSEGGLCGPEGAMFEPAPAWRRHIRHHLGKYMLGGGVGYLYLIGFFG